MAAGPGGAVWAVSQGQLHRLEPGGETWSRVGPEDAGLGRVGVGPDAVVLVSSRERGLERLEGGADADATLVPVQGLPEGAVEALAGGPDGLVVHLRVTTDAEGPPAFRTTDGRSWSPVEGLEGEVTGLSAGPDGTLYAFVSMSEPPRRLLLSTDGGVTWEALPVNGLDYTPPSGQTHHRNVTGAAALPDGTLYAGTQSGGAYRLPPGATAWEPVMEGLETGDVETVHVTPGGAVLLSTPRGVYRR